MIATPTSFAGYTILRPLGSGGMADVYLAKHPRLPRRDAMKVLSEGTTADHEFRERFNREADLAATLWHPHIVGVHDRGEFDGHLWISMDYVEGTDAARLVKERYRDGMPVDEVCAIVTPSPVRSITPTTAACCTATSNPPTSCLPIPTRMIAESCWRTSA